MVKINIEKLVMQSVQGKIHHPTIQVELYEENFHCHLKPEDVL